MPRAFAPVLRFVLLGLLLAGVALKPSLAIAEEMHELLSHAVAAGDGHTHEDAHAVQSDPSTDGQSPHDDSHFHLTHCCGQQAAVLPRLDLVLSAPATASPIPAHAMAFRPAPHAAPFRPPIMA